MLSYVVTELEVKKIPLELIKFDETNPNELSQEQMVSLKLTMEKFGYLAPVILNQDLTVVDGEHRVRIYQQLGKKEIQAYVIDVDKIDLKILRQLMNKLRGEHDKQKDSLEFKSIYDSGRLDEFSKLLAQPREEFEAILSRKFDIDFIQETNEIPYINRETDVKLGDIYQLGNHRVMCGDSTKSLDILLDGKTVDLLLTDPPYGINIVHGSRADTTSKLGFVGIKDKPKSSLAEARIYKEIINDDKPFNPEFLLKYGKSQIIFGANNFSSKLIDSASWIVWDKKIESGGGLDHNNFSDVELAWTNNNGKSCMIYRHLWSGLLRKGDRKTELKDRVHPTQKPVGLLSDVIKDYSEEQMTVLDPFLGSGSTLIACESSNRVCYGMELDPYYVDVIIRRWENYAGKKAVKISSNVE